jgi:hypothetical protein
MRYIFVAYIFISNLIFGQNFPGLLFGERLNDTVIYYDLTDSLKKCSINYICKTSNFVDVFNYRYYSGDSLTFNLEYARTIADQDGVSWLADEHISDQFIVNVLFNQAPPLFFNKLRGRRVIQFFFTSRNELISMKLIYPQQSSKHEMATVFYFMESLNNLWLIKSESGYSRKFYF